MDSKLKFYVIDGKIGVRFAVSGLNDGNAKDKAVKMIKKLFETGILGSCAYNFSIENVVETKPIP